MTKLNWTKCEDGLGSETTIGNYVITRLTCKNYKTYGTTNIHKYMVRQVQPFYRDLNVEFRSLKATKAYIQGLQDQPKRSEYHVLIECVSNGSRGKHSVHAYSEKDAFQQAKKDFEPTYRVLGVFRYDNRFDSDGQPSNQS